MKKTLMVMLLLAGAVAFTTAQAWAGKAAMLSDKELDAVYGGHAIDSVSNSFNNNNDVDVTATSAQNRDNSNGTIAQAQANSDQAVQVAATCDICDHALRVRDSSQRRASAVNLLNTVASNNAQQSNVGTSGSGSTVHDIAQANVAYSSTGSINHK